ncbi:DNA-processing protein DprA [Agathobaculum sp.]|uniref:DNA-processing protein DprA n=1 Tax=Agathobaculum sp. TaxID=2048138 RepID=UPI002A815D78|nr:DNA-processing protein DprA [Agathobaculum sp.]MDY3618576.1 DNA-processing protein DprA [Agathobaculum sp.]
MSVRESFLWLSRKNSVGAGTAADLLRIFGSAEAVYAADRERFATCGCPLTKRQVDALCDKDLDEAARILEACAHKGISVLTIADTAYPDRLRAIADPPLVLYVRGSWPDFDAIPAIAVVGTRKSTGYGERIAESLGRALAEAGFVVVSGMAAGNDAAAHRGALRAGGLTVACFAGGVDVCYPPENQRLMGDILLSGAIVSEQPPGERHLPGHFHGRNRILSGLCVAAVVVEAAGSRSGTMITAHAALDQGRDVYAVPGAVGAPQSAGCNELIANGEAEILTGPETLIRAYGGLMRNKPDERLARQAFERQTGERRKPAELSAWDEIQKREQAGRMRKAEPPHSSPAPLPDTLSPEERQIAELVAAGASTPAEVVDKSELSAARVMAILTMLEMDGVLIREKGALRLR